MDLIKPNLRFSIFCVFCVSKGTIQIFIVHNSVSYDYMYNK